MLELQRQGITRFHIELAMRRGGVGIYLPADDGNLQLAAHGATLRECVDALMAAKAEEKNDAK